VKLSQEQFIEAISPHIDDRIQFDLSYSDVWLLLGALQFTLCNLELPETIQAQITHLNNTLTGEIVPTTILARLAQAEWEQPPEIITD